MSNRNHTRLSRAYASWAEYTLYSLQCRHFAKKCCFQLTKLALSHAYATWCEHTKVRHLVVTNSKYRNTCEILAVAHLSQSLLHRTVLWWRQFLRIEKLNEVTLS